MISDPKIATHYEHWRLRMKREHTHTPSILISKNFNHKVMALRIAAASTSRFTKPYNPSPLFSASFHNLTLKFHLPQHANAFSPIPIRKPGIPN
jgi:hypothetical protein